MRRALAQPGFTLVEVAFVLAIAGLILFLVLRTNSPISSAQVKELQSEIAQIQAAATSFRARFGGVPGDLPNANQKFSALTAADNGDGDGLVSVADSAHVARQLQASGVLANVAILTDARPGMYTKMSVVSFALSASGASPCGTAVNSTAPVPQVANVILIEGLPASAAGILDRELDDGVFNSGKVRASADYVAGTTINCFAVPLLP